MNLHHSADGIHLWRGDARNVSQFLDPESVDLIVTSPPYFALRSYTDGGEHYDGQIGSEATPGEFVDALLACTADWMRVLKPGGSIFVNLGDKYSGSGPLLPPKFLNTLGPSIRWQPIGKPGIPAKSLMGLPWRYALRCIDELDLILRAEIVWSKPNGLPESVTDRVRRSHEQWFHFTRQGRYFAAVDEVREPHIHAANGSTFGGRKSVDAAELIGASARRQGLNTYDDLNPLGKLPGSVWTIPSEPLTVPDHLGVDHFAAFPTEWPRRIILGWSPAGGTVLDPFGGTGTVALVARALGRHAHHVDLSGDYLRLAEWRIWHDTNAYRRASERSGIPVPQPAPDGQLDMFGEAS